MQTVMIQFGYSEKATKNRKNIPIYLTLISTLDSGINIGVRLLIYGIFSMGYVLNKEGNPLKKSEIMLFNVVGYIFSGTMFLIREGNAYFFQDILCLMIWGMPILRATLNVFAKCSRSYVYSRGYFYSRVY